MDNLRGAFDASEPADDNLDWDSIEEQDARDVPPDSIGQDERRMQVRAYNHWASLLGERSFPPIEDLEPESLPDFGPYSVVLDFSAGIEDPAVQYLGGSLAEECGAEGHISKLSDVPPRSLLSRITDHYMQILANQSPIGFEAEFVNQRGIEILYRGILLPFSSDNETIDFIYGVINWKEMADQVSADKLLLEIDAALETEEDIEAEADEPVKHHAGPVTEWADSPSHEMGGVSAISESTDYDVEQAEEAQDEEPLDLGDFADVTSIGAGEDDTMTDGDDEHDDLPTPKFGEYALDDLDELDEDGEEEDDSSYDFASLTDYIEAPTKKALALDLDAPEGDDGDYENDDFGTSKSDDSDFAMPDFSALNTAPEAEPDFAPEPANETFGEPTPMEEEVEIAAAPDDAEQFNDDAADETPIEDAPAEYATFDETPLELGAAEEVAPYEAPMEQPPVDEAVAEEAAVEQAPTEEPAFDDTPVEETPVEETPADAQPVDEAPVEDSPVEAPVEDAVVEDAPVEMEHAVGTVADEKASDERAPLELSSELIDDLPQDAGLYDCLASARELAQTANATEDRSRQALYAAVGRAYDFSLAAQEAPEDYNELIEESGLTVQERAPMTPVVKLVFGADYDKTRLTEYAAVLSHAHREGLERGSLAKFLTEAEGGLKGVVQAERRLRREEAGKEVDPLDGPREALAKQLRELEAMMFEALDADGPEFGLVMIRRTEDGDVELLGEIEQDIPMIERAARKLVG